MRDSAGRTAEPAAMCRKRLRPGFIGSTPSYLDDQIICLHRDRKILGDVGTFDQFLARGHHHLELTGAHGLRIAIALAGRDFEFPSVPRTAHEFSVADKAVLAGAGRLPAPGDTAFAERAALVRASIGECIELAADVEHPDLAALGGDELAAPRHDLGGAGDDVAAHRVTTNDTTPWRCRAEGRRVA